MGAANLEALYEVIWGSLEAWYLWSFGTIGEGERGRILVVSIMAFPSCNYMVENP